ncbi:tRNA (adenosine(37)-N6)-dimethylallyltransferase MiaA, partial [Candidatus Microgenomates bacterium]|nr:tRNA (adenosine(37)-N6)-dimethylallyltransferase MiaA [Candidatus Microgenomates bacterium]
GELISADSRQVYKNMDIGTGKEWGEGVVIHGYDLVEPTEGFSVSQFERFAQKKIVEILKKGKLPILVGGTGLYIKAVVDGIPTLSVPQDKTLRKELKSAGVGDLYDNLAVLDPSKAASLNLSDSKNPRRLIRAIEVAQWNIAHGSKEGGEIKKRKKKNKYDTLFIGISVEKELLLERIEKRVEERMNGGFVYEIESLLKSGVSWDNQSMASLGYSEAEYFLKEGLSYEDFIERWVINEFKYAKRQITWFKKDERINWFDVQNSKYPVSVEKMVKKWYSTGERDYAKKD